MSHHTDVWKPVCALNQCIPSNGLKTCARQRPCGLDSQKPCQVLLLRNFINLYRVPPAGPGRGLAVLFTCYVTVNITFTRLSIMFAAVAC